MSCSLSAICNWVSVYSFLSYWWQVLGHVWWQLIVASLFSVKWLLSINNKYYWILHSSIFCTFLFIMTVAAAVVIILSCVTITIILIIFSMMSRFKLNLNNSSNWDRTQFSPLITFGVLLHFPLNCHSYILLTGLTRRFLSKYVNDIAPFTWVSIHEAHISNIHCYQAPQRVHDVWCFKVASCMFRLGPIKHVWYRSNHKANLEHTSCSLRAGLIRVYIANIHKRVLHVCFLV